MANFILLLAILCFHSAYSKSAPEIYKQFDWINFTFSDPIVASQYVSQEEYKNCMPAGIKVNSNEDVFVSIPRWKGCWPATLNMLFYDKSINKTLFQPFPSFEGNEINKSYALQSVLGFEIDLDDNIWALDQGRVNNVAIEGGMKLNKYSKNGTLIDHFDLSNVTYPEYSFLNDLVLDSTGKFIYITDSGIPINTSNPLRPALIVINLANRQIVRVLENDTSVMPDQSLWITINHQRVNQDSPMETGADGIALSCDKKTLYYTPLTSRTLYAINTKVLQTATSQSNLSEYVIKLGYKLSASDGLICSQNGHMYLTALELNAVLFQSDITPNAENFQFNVFSPIVNSSKLIWPDTLGFNNVGKELFIVANQLQNFMAGTINFTNPLNGDSNFYIWKVYVNDRSYLEDCITSSSGGDEDKFPVWAIVLVVVVVLVVVIIAVCAVRNYMQARKKRKTFL
ncbi:hypothetical protein SteCoe_12269 [Stentor coeruleus]|uniref:SMP-30/Gluconolactonase/LRE-like region domain-containing protein n=1 Tax=Stentor coeruleus TaxID=5963 RepID=A0A1R2CBA6_9CILI|nr:hypothetical protein SteCoe_12269 [Stentor coeruleus]